MISSGLLISWALAVLACLSGMVGVLSKPIQEQDSDKPRTPIKRITWGGWTAIVLAIATLVLALVNVSQANRREQEVDQRVQEMHTGLFNEFQAAEAAREAAQADRKRASGEYELAHQAQVAATKFRDDARQRLLSLDDQLQQATTDLAALTEEMNNIKAEAKKFREARKKVLSDINDFIEGIESIGKKLKEFRKKIAEPFKF